MDWNEYLKASQRTSAEDSLQHAVLGIGTEAGELLDAYKKNRFYAAPLDRVNLKEEIGDLMWYVAMLCRNKGFDLHECLDLNIAKLKRRYPNAFDEVKAVYRNLPAERNALETPLDASARIQTGDDL